MKNEKTYRCAPIRIQLQEGNQVEEIPTRVQLLRTGTFFDPRYGKIEITKDKLDHMVQKFGEGVRGIELMIDYKHDTEAEAAGWIKGLEVIEVQLTEEDLEKGIEQSSEFQLWSDVEWTSVGSKKLSDKEFAYLSADFDPEYKCNENPEVNHGHVLLGAALTNRPVIKRMNPAIQLGESEQLSTDKKEISKMENDQEQEKKLADLETENTQIGGKLEKVKSLMSDLGVESIEDLMKMISGLREENETMLSEKKNIEKKIQLDELLKEGKINAAQHEGAMKLSESEFKGFISMTKVGEKVVKLSETGTNETPAENQDEKDPQDQVIELAEKKMIDNKEMTFSEATALVLKENKELSKKYNA